MDSLPTPPTEDHLKSQVPKRPHSNSKPVKPVHRGTKRPGSHIHPTSPSETHSHSIGDGRHKRVWKACERCRMKKTKCDGEFPCKRCKDDGLVCTAGTRKKTEYKQLPRGYAEVLENTQFALIATVHKLYNMVRNQQTWDLGEPELNDRGQPVIHNIASKLGCIRPNSDMDLPVHSVFPEDEAGLVELARQLEEQQQLQPTTTTISDGPSTVIIKQEPGTMSAGPLATDCASSCTTRTFDRASSSELDQSDFEHDAFYNYRKTLFTRGTETANTALTMSPASLGYHDFDLHSVVGTPSELSSSSSTCFSASSVAGTAPPSSMPPSAATFSSNRGSNASWMSRPPSMDFASAMPLFGSGGGVAPGAAAAAGFLDLDLLNQGLLESNFGAIKPHVLSCPNPEVMLGMGDPMMYSGYDVESLRL